jgi:shikimate kinase
MLKPGLFAYHSRCPYPFQRNGMTQQNIVLTGFMGTGKSTVGRMLAKRLQYNFVDTDALIESRQNRTVAQIFEQNGEQVFRALEKETAAELSTQEGLVISTGGKMLLDPENLQALGRNGRVFCLVADSDEIVRRLSRSHSREKRPLLASKDPERAIRELLQQREAAYRQFEQIDTTDKSPHQICRILLELYLQNKTDK